ncbi:MAG: endonuclease [Thermoleophilia bacterium]|nr:endonuclease [Thermoleophilia bacterium]
MPGGELRDLPPATAERYYQPTQGRHGVALLRALHDITEHYHQPRSYVDARELMFADVEDPHGTNIVTDLYTGQRIHGIAGLASATRSGLSTEHVWPQSEGAREEARSDLHHLRPALQRLNAHRSNLAFGEVASVEWASDPVKGVDELSVVGAAADGTKVFSPRASMRGDLARDQLYFFTRYYGDRPTAFSLDNFRTSLPSLLRWHREDPVDAAERARNDAIFALQGNRNPYVDRPAFVDRIGFTDALLTRA